MLAETWAEDYQVLATSTAESPVWLAGAFLYGLCFHTGLLVNNKKKIPLLQETITHLLHFNFARSNKNNETAHNHNRNI